MIPPLNTGACNNSGLQSLDGKKHRELTRRTKKQLRLATVLLQDRSRYPTEHAGSSYQSTARKILLGTLFANLAPVGKISFRHGRNESSAGERRRRTFLPLCPCCFRACRRDPAGLCRGRRCDSVLLRNLSQPGQSFTLSAVLFADVSQTAAGIREQRVVDMSTALSCRSLKETHCAAVKLAFLPSFFLNASLARYQAA